MICDRSAASAAWSESARRIGSSTSSTNRPSPGSQPTVEIVVRRCVMPRSGSRRAAASTSSRFSIGSPIPMKTQWSTRVEPAEMQSLVEDLRCGQVAPERICARRAERARERAARLRGEAERAPTVAEAHQHGLDRLAVRRCGRASSRCRRATRASVSTASVENGTPSASSRAQRARADSSSRRSRYAPRAVHAHTCRARKAGSPCRAASASGPQIHRLR